MSKFISVTFLLVLATLCCGSGSSDCISKDGYFRGVKLAGCVRIVESGGDFKVRIVDSCEDLRVEIDNAASRTSKPGHWRFVTRGGDFTIRIVTACEDFSIRLDECCAGVKKPCPTRPR